MDMTSSSSSSSSSTCSRLQNPNTPTVFLASVILVGILISYLPQHIKIYSRRSSDGLSPWWVLLGGLSSIAAIGNILVLPSSRADIKCCKDITGFECAAAFLGIAQIGLQWTCFMLIVFLFLIFFPAQTTPPPDLSASLGSLTSLHPTPTPKRRDAILVTTLILASLLLTALISLAIVAIYPHHTQSWANTLGTIAGTLATVQYLPQIFFTYRVKDVKSLSIVTMIIQVPGAFLFAFSLWLRVGWEGWSTWLVYLVTGVLQGILLGLAVVYYLERRGMKEVVVEGSDGEEEEDVPVDERSALLGSEGTGRQSNGHARPVVGTQRSTASGQAHLDLLYRATPPEHDSD